MLPFEKFTEFTRDLQRAGWIEQQSYYKISDHLPIHQIIDKWTPDEKKSSDYVHYQNGSLIELRFADDGIFMSYLSAGKSKNAGVGSECMTTLAKLADKHCLPVTLETYSQESILEDLKRLFAFYKRFGFEFFQTTNWEDVVSESDLTDNDHYEGVPMKRTPSIKQDN
ncbi:conserved hypothetical protein [Vibrio chagasii]|nr:conserved hypothetical protein [Vibrio chagasii]